MAVAPAPVCIMSWNAFMKGLSAKKSGVLAASSFLPAPKKPCIACVKGLSKGLACGSGFLARPVASIHCCIIVAIGLLAKALFAAVNWPVACLNSPPISVSAMAGSICL
ncbi:hypothetical protein D3C72_1490490 [compost metagenome]